METEQWIKVYIHSSDSMQQLIRTINIEMKQWGMTLNYVNCPNENITIKQLFEEGRLITIYQTKQCSLQQQNNQNITKKEQENNNIGSCHSCKTRREMYFICQTNRYHKFCERCFKKYSMNHLCPICHHLCECAGCKRLVSDQKISLK